MALVDLPQRIDVSTRKVPAPALSFWRSYGYIFPSFAIALLVCAWFSTWGDWKFFEREHFCGFYDAQALSMLDGRFDVPPAAIADEAFVFHGKAFGYFGIAPSLLRVPLVIAFAGMDGRWSRVMMLIGCAVNLFCAYRILLILRGDRATTSAQRWLHSLFLLIAGVGSTNIFLASRSFTYHEAIMWSGAFALLCGWMILEYVTRPNFIRLIFAGAFAFMSFHSRPTAGAGALLALCGLAAILSRRNRAHALVLFAAALVIVSAYLAVNYAKFRTFNGVPLQYYAWYHAVPVRMQITGGRQIHLANIPTMLLAYFGLPGIMLGPQFPWFFLLHHVTRIGAPAIDMVDAFSSIPVSMPALSLLALIGVFARRKNESKIVATARALAFAFFAGGAVVLMSVGICERYLHDFYPALIVAGAIGVGRIETLKRIAPLTLAIALTFLSILINCAFSLTQQRTTTGAPPEKEIEFRRWQQNIGWSLGN